MFLAAPRLPALLQLLLALALLHAANSDLGAHYTKSPEPIAAPLGDNVVFSCQTNIPAERVAWRHRPGPGAPWADVRPAPAGPLRLAAKPALSKLTVTLHNESLAGDYRCVSWYGASALASVAARLSVARLGPAPRLPERVLRAPPLAPVLIRCPPPPSEPPPSMTYYRIIDGVAQAGQGGEEPGGGLLVRAGPLGSSQDYKCYASNFLSDQRRDYSHRITVQARGGVPEAPTFTEDMVKEMTGIEGTSVVLLCGALGRPSPQLAWRRDGAPLPSRASTDANTLNITNLQLGDEGEYTCTATNTVGSAERTVRLTVWAPPVMEGEGDRGDWMAHEGSSQRVPCPQPSGSPLPVISWLINGEEINKDPNIKVSEYEIVINPVEKRHAGMVQCFATNVLGSVTAENLLRVVPKQHAAAQGGGGDAGMGELGSPRPSISNGNGRRHSKPGKGRNHNRKIMIPPSQPNVTRLSDESVMVKWSAKHNEGLPIQFFKVQYREMPQEDRGVRSKGSKWMTTNHEIPPHVRSYEVDGLEPDHAYRFRIAAVYSNNDNKLGRNSARFLLHRGSGLAKAPPAPLLTHAESVSPTDIRLFWELPESGGEEIRIEGFYVYYRPASSAGEYSKAAVEGGWERSLLLRHLSPASPYELKLQSFTPAAASNFSAIITQRTLKLPVVEQVKEVVAPPETGAGSGGSGHLYGIIGGVTGGAALLALIVALIMCKRRKNDTPDKQPEGGCGPASGGAGELSNGYLSPSAPPAKPSITITANPLHPEGENVDVEMSYISAQNNNCSTQSPRVSAELVHNASSCRDELRKQSPLPTMATRENYV